MYHLPYFIHICIIITVDVGIIGLVSVCVWGEPHLDFDAGKHMVQKSLQVFGFLKHS